jgi:hypothetical protein
MVDCFTGKVVWHDTMAYPTGTSKTSAAGRLRRDPTGSLYALRVTGEGVLSGVGLINSKFSSHPPANIIPFVAWTSCF